MAKVWRKDGTELTVNFQLRMRNLMYMLVCSDKSGTSDGKQKKRLYFKCYNKSCPAKMIVDVDSTTGEELVPFLSGGQ